MVDRIVIDLPVWSARQLRTAADRLGLAPQTLARRLLMIALEEERSTGVAEPGAGALRLESETARKTCPQDYDGPVVDLDEALNAFDAELERRLAARAD